MVLYGLIRTGKGIVHMSLGGIGSSQFFGIPPTTKACGYEMLEGHTRLGWIVSPSVVVVRLDLAMPVWCPSATVAGPNARSTPCDTLE